MTDMMIEFRCEREHARRWMKRGSLSIKGQDIPIQIAGSATPEPRPSGLETLFALERLVLRRGKRSEADQLTEVWKQSPSAGNADVIVDFTGAERDPNCSARLYLRPLFNGIAGENAALAAILAGDLPGLEIVKA